MVRKLPPVRRKRTHQKNAQWRHQGMEQESWFRMSIDFKHWLDRAEAIPFRMAELRFDANANYETTLAWEYLREIERAARCLVAGAYIDPNPKLREFGVASIRVGTVHFADLVNAIESLNQVAEYLSSPLPQISSETRSYYCSTRPPVPCGCQHKRHL